MATKLTKVTGLDQLSVGDQVRTTGGRIDWEVFAVRAIGVSIKSLSNRGVTLVRFYPLQKLRNLRAVTYCDWDL